MKRSSLLDNLKYNETGNSPSVNLLMRSPFSKEIRILFRKGQYMQEHYTPSPIMIQVYEGSIEFGAENDIVILEKGDQVYLDGGHRHDLTALEDSIVKLSLHTQDSYGHIKEFIKNQDEQQSLGIS